MNFRKRIIIANVLTVVIPLLITGVIALASFFIFTKIWGINLSWENYRKLSQVRLELLNIEADILLRAPDTAEDENFPVYLQERLAALGGEFIILRDEQVINASAEFSKIDVAKFLEAGKDRGSRETILAGTGSYVVQRVDPAYKNGARGSVLLLAPVEPGNQKATAFLMLTAAVFLLSFVLTIILVAYYFSRSMVSPLRSLQTAAEEISRGNLDQPIAEEGDEELKALCRDLELMRLKLKESVYTQLKYEDNRKMLISSISHDLKTPVTSIMGYVEGILDGVADTADKRERYLQTIAAKARQVDQMIDDLLLYAKLDVNQLPFDFERTDFGEYLEFFVAESETELEKRNVKISFRSELLEKRQYAALDRGRMKRVLTNIIDNACKHMDKAPGEIRVVLRETAASLIVELRDNGSGIKQEDLPFIFDRFYRSDEARREGSGLGLAIAKQIVEGHQGRIWAISHGGEGTAVMVSLRKSAAEGKTPLS